MENNSNAIAEIQKKYAGCNLLMPAATEVQLNPFYKITVMEVTADLSENSGDIFKVGSVKTGTGQGHLGRNLFSGKTPSYENCRGSWHTV
jgi:hypothetical protein